MAENILFVLRQLREDARWQLNNTSHALRESWEQGEIEGLLEAIRGGLVQEPWVSRVIFDLQRQRLYGKATEDHKQAEGKLKQIADALVNIGRGKTEIPLEKREQIIGDCKKWRPICEDLNKMFKKLWEQVEYESSERHRKETRGKLAEKLNISVADVKAIESYLKKPSQRSTKSTPTQALCRMVARKHLGIGEKTVEKIWGDYLDEHPEESRKKRTP